MLYKRLTPPMYLPKPIYIYLISTSLAKKAPPIRPPEQKLSMGQSSLSSTTVSAIATTNRCSRGNKTMARPHVILRPEPT